MYFYVELPEQLAEKSLKQCIRMIQTRIKRDIEAQETIRKYSEYPYDDIPKYQRMVTKALDVQDDCCKWLNSAFYGFSPALWDEIISQPVTTKDGEKHQMIDVWGSHNMG